MSQGCAMVLLLAMMLAIAAGLMAGGPIVITPHDHSLAASRAWRGIPHVARLLACVPLAAVAAWGWRVTRQKAWPDALRTAWLGFFGTGFATAVAAALYHLNPSDAGFALIHVCIAAATTTLTLAFMAERIDALFGRSEAVVGACSVAGCAGLWWLAGHWVGGPADLRALVFLECMPLLLVPAGALGLPGEHTRSADWLIMLALHALARSAALADELFEPLRRGIGGHALALCLMAAMAAWAAYRISSVSRGGPAWALSSPTQRSTSLNTSS
jgi:hypothetical protein